MLLFHIPSHAAYLFDEARFCRTEFVKVMEIHLALGEGQDSTGCRMFSMGQDLF